MAQINAKGVSAETKQALKYLAVALATTESEIIRQALQNFIEQHRGSVQEGKRTIEKSPMRKG